MKCGSTTLTFLHGDHLHSTVLPTRGGAANGQERYYAYGKDRLATASVPTDNRFTGQKEDGTGLIYMNARYYDPITGQFVSPDTLVPDAMNLFEYNRYLYVRGNPLKYTDPTGHCTVTEDGQRADDDRDCWAYVYEILRLWSIDPTYWDQRFVSQENFLENMAPQSVLDRDWMFGQYDEYLRSEDYRRAYNLQQEKRKEFPTQPLNYGPGPCEIWDCTDMALNSAIIGGDMLRSVAPACGPAAGVCYLAGNAVVRAASLGSYAYITHSYMSGQSSEFDVAFALAGDIATLNNEIPVATSVSAGIQLLWNVADPLVPDDPQPIAR